MQAAPYGPAAAGAKCSLKGTECSLKDIMRFYTLEFVAIKLQVGNIQSTLGNIQSTLGNIQ
jgi:hypothetical protein